MRTTLTLDPDVAQMLAEEAHRRRVPFKQVVNDAIRRGLSAAQASSKKPVTIKPHKTSLRGGIDGAGFNKLADELENDAVSRRLPRRA